jgi:hypothetical protein
VEPLGPEDYKSNVRDLMKLLAEKLPKVESDVLFLVPESAARCSYVVFYQVGSIGPRGLQVKRA